jgi:hypothetical protein
VVIGETANGAGPVALLLLFVVLLTVFLAGPVVWWTAKLRRWEAAIRRDPGAWVRVLGGRPAAPRPSGPVFFSCGVPSSKMGPAFLVAFDADDLIVVRQGVVRATTIRIRRTDGPRIHFRDPTRFHQRTIEINTSRGGSVAIEKGPVTSIARSLAACGWAVDPMPDPTSTMGCGEPVGVSEWPLPEVDPHPWN